MSAVAHTTSFPAYFGERVLCLLAWVLFSISSLCADANPWDADSIRSIFADRTLRNIEGVWQFPDDGATILITSASASTYDIIVIDSPDFTVVPGTLMGCAVETPTPNRYDVSLSNTNKRSNRALGSKHAVFSVTPDGTLSVKPYSTGVKLSINRLIYRLLKISIVNNDNRPSDLDGARRIYPVVYSKSSPVCL